MGRCHKGEVTALIDSQLDAVGKPATRPEAARVSSQQWGCTEGAAAGQRCARRHQRSPRSVGLFMYMGQQVRK
jgi:erythromycin esterase-like protein